MKIFLILSLLFLTGCGYSSRNNEAIMQIKKVSQHTPLVCSDYDELDGSLGVMRNGTGSVSTQDIELLITNEEHKKVLIQAAESGKLVKVHYDTKRFTWCVPSMHLKSVEIIE